MTQRIPIQVHIANALQWLGTLYRSPADALKDFKLQARGRGRRPHAKRTPGAEQHPLDL